MDEILRAKRLTEEILKRAASIKTTMDSVNKSMATIKLIEAQAAEKQVLSRPLLKLMDLPDDCLFALVAMLQDHISLCALAQTCSRFQVLVYGDWKGWEARCRLHWGIIEHAPEQVPRLDTGLFVATPLASSAAGNGTAQQAPAGPDAPARCSGQGMQVDVAARGFDLASVYDMEDRGNCASRPTSHTTGPLAWAQLSPGPRTGSAMPARLSGPGRSLSGTLSPGSRSSSVRQRASATGDGDGGVGRGGRGEMGQPGETETEQRARIEALSAVTAGPGNLWRLIYWDRHKGWQLVRQMLTWLRTHNHPRSVTGSVHRLQLVLALRYMMLGTSQPTDKPRKQQIQAAEGIRSLLELLDNESTHVVEMALHVLANLMQADPDARVQLLIGSCMGKVFTDRLELGGGKQPAVVHAAARALVTMWTVGPLPEVTPLDGQNQPAVPALEPGLWHLQEFTLRGECMQMVCILLSFNQGVGSTMRLVGAGVDHSGGTQDEFDVSGSVDLVARSWTWQRRSRTAHHQTILYRGYTDLWGSFGCYATQRADGSAASFLVSNSRQPRVYRLFRSGEEPGTTSCAASASGAPGSQGHSAQLPVLLSPPRSSDVSRSSTSSMSGAEPTL